jgi:hypothetical protein
MKALLTERFVSQDFSFKDFQMFGYSYGFLCQLNNPWNNNSNIRVEFNNMDYPLFYNVDSEDEFEIEVIIKRKPKATQEIKSFK